MDLSRRDLARMGGALAITAAVYPGSSLAAAATSPAPAIDPMTLVDPELRPLAKTFEQMFGSLPPLSDKSLPGLRSAIWYGKPQLAAIPVAERRVAGAKGSPDVTVYVINAKAGAARPGILHTHGGGYVMGSAKETISILQELSAALDCTIVTVEYRLAPETHYSGSIEDNYAGLRWMHTHAAELGIDPARIAVMGESAGGGHAALLAITARDRGEVPLIFQMLIYPMLDDRTGSSRPVPKHIGTIGWTAENNRFGWRAFLGREPGGRTVPAAGVPARVANLAGLPPTFIGVGALDLFVDENIEYAQRLVNAGVPTELLLVPGAFHGFDMSDAGVAKRFTAAKIDALRRAFGAAGKS